MYSLIPLYHFLTFSVPCEPILGYSGIMLSRSNFNNIDVITDIGIIGTISLGKFATTQINRNEDNFYLLQNNTNKDYNVNSYK